jgi:hypothetical protein
MLEAKQSPSGHDIYKQVRALDVQAQKAPDAGMFIKQHAVDYDKLSKQMNELYSGAWNQGL